MLIKTLSRWSAFPIIFLVVIISGMIDYKEVPAPRKVIKVAPLPRIVFSTALEIPKTPVRKTNRADETEYIWLSRICVNEGDFNFDECQKILQTLENMRGQGTLLSVMYAQSSRVTRKKLFADTRQIWTSYLPMQGEKPPEKGWIECKGNSSKGCTGTWKNYVKKWAAFREQVRVLYYSGIVPELIPGVPIQWGGDMDYWRGAGRNFCPLNNPKSASQNTFWGDTKNPDNIGKCLPIDNLKVARSRVLSKSIADKHATQREQVLLLLDKPAKID